MRHQWSWSFTYEWRAERPDSKNLALSQAIESRKSPLSNDPRRDIHKQLFLSWDQSRDALVPTEKLATYDPDQAQKFLDLLYRRNRGQVLQSYIGVIDGGIADGVRNRLGLQEGMPGLSADFAGGAGTHRDSAEEESWN